DFPDCEDSRARSIHKSFTSSASFWESNYSNGSFSFYDPNVDKIKEVEQDTDIQEKETKKSQRQTNPSTEWKGQSQKSSNEKITT
ncbi:hypothetical protein Tco_1258320, partial [Tanacetum coccineum]